MPIYLFLVLVSSLVLCGCADQHTSSSRLPPDAANKPTTLATPGTSDKTGVPDGVTPSQWASIRAQITTHAHRFQPTANHWSFDRPQQPWRGEVDRHGALYLTAQERATLSWRLTAWGRPASLVPTTQHSGSTLTEDTLRFQYDELSVWYKNTPSSLMQGFDITTRPSGDGPLEVHLSVGDSFHLHGGGAHITARPSNGAPGASWQYGQLAVWDREGHPVRAHMRVDGQKRMAIVVDDTNAHYPLTIDPVFERIDALERVVPIASYEQTNEDALFGASIAIDDDTMVIGAPQYKHPTTHTPTGVVFVFDKIGAGPSARWRLIQQLLSTNSIDAQRFGASVALDGDVLIVGEPDAQITTPNEGRAFVFTRPVDLWSQVDVLVSPDRQLNEQFGSAVTIGNGIVFVGAPGTATANGTGSVYHFINGGDDVYMLDGPRFEPQRADTRRFGQSLSFDGQTLAVGAPESTVQGIGTAGLVYTFDYNDGQSRWDFVSVIQHTTPSQSAFFGASLSLDDDFLLIGAPGATAPLDPSIRVGAAYLHERGTTQANAWQSVVREFRSPSPQVSDLFGYAVLLEGSMALISSPHDRALDPNQRFGAVFVFEQNQPAPQAWGLTSKISAPDGIDGDNFGQAIAFDGDRFVAASTMSDFGARDAGAVYSFAAPTMTTPSWSFLSKLGGEMPLARASYGFSLDVSGDWMIVGAPNASVGNLANAGKVYLFERDTSLTSRQWVLQSEVLKPTSPRADDLFGFSVAIDGQSFAVGSPSSVSVGTVFIYERAGNTPQWNYIVSHLAPGANSRDKFGFSLALANDVLVVGRPTEFGIYPRGLAVVIPKGNDQWRTKTPLPIPATLPNNAQFGYDVDINDQGNVIVVGAPARDLTTSPGTAWVFEQNMMTWDRTQLNGMNIQNDSDFGMSVAINDISVAIGAPNHKDGGPDAKGQVAVLGKSTGSWQPINFLIGTAVNQQLGLSINMSADVMAIGSADSTINLYDRDNLLWVPSVNQPIVRAPNATYTGFGQSIVVDGNGLYVGAPELSTSRLSGAVYAFGIDVPVRAVATNHTLNVTEDTPASLQLALERAAQGYSFQIVTMPTKSQRVTLSADGVLDYTPRVNANGTDYMIYVATHPQRDDTNYGTVIFSIAPVEDPIEVPDRTYSTPENTALVAPLEVINPDGNPLMYTWMGPSSGTFSLDQSTDTFRFVPAPDVVGQVTISLTATEAGTGRTSTGTLTVDVGEPPTAPIITSMVPERVELVAGTPWSTVIEFSSRDPDVIATFVGFTGSSPTASISPDMLTRTVTIEWTPTINDVGANQSVSLVLTNAVGTTTVPFEVTVTQPAVTITTPTSSMAVASDEVVVEGTALFGEDVVLTLVGAQTYTTTVTPDAQNTFSASIEGVANGDYTLMAKQGAKTTEVAVMVNALGITEDPTVNGGTKDDGVIIAPEGEPVVISGVLPENGVVVVIIIDEDGNRTEFTEDNGVTVNGGRWQFTVPADYIGQEVDVIVEITDKNTNKKATLRLKVRTTSYNPDQFIRNGCQSTHGSPVQLWPLLLMGFVGLLRRRIRC